MAKVMTREEAMNYESIASIDPYFKTNSNGTMTFMGDKLEVRIPKRYEVYGLLNIGDTIHTLAIVDLIINDKYRAGLLMMCAIEMDNGELNEVVIDGITYLCVTLTKGDTFMHSTTIVRNKNIVYTIFVEFISVGKIIYWMDYRTTFGLFDQAGPMADGKIDVDHVLFEVLYSHLFRDREDLTVQYRYTSQREPPVMIGLRNISYGTDSTTSKLLGSYFDVGLNQALITQTKDKQIVEDLLRL